MQPLLPSTAAPRRVELVLLGLVLVAALALRVAHLGAPALTGDEWFMLRNAQEGAAWIIHQARTFEPHPLLYYLGFWAWVGAAGTTEWAMRYPSALFGVLTCAAGWRLAREVAGPGLALGAALLLAINPYQVAQSQNARNYAMVAALASVATVLLVIARRRGGATWLVYAVGMLLALHTHLNALLVLAAHTAWIGLDLLGRRARPSRDLLRAAGLIGLLFVPWLVYAAPALTAYRGYYPERVGLVEVATRTLGTFAFGQQETARRALVGAVGGLAGLGALWALWLTWRRGRPEGLLVALVAGVPVLGAAALFVVRPMFEERYLIVGAPATIVLIAMGAWVLGRLHPGVGVAALAGAIALTQPFLGRYYPAVEQSRPDWRGLAGWIARAERPGDIVLVTGQGVADAYRYYARAEAPIAVVAQEATAVAELDRVLAARPTGAFWLPYLDEPTDRLAHDRLVAVGAPGETRWFRNQRVQYIALPGSAPARPIGAQWGEAIRLDRVEVSPPRVAPGGVVSVVLYWQGDRGPDLKLSLRLIGAEGRSLAQLDRRPVDDARPFPSLRAGEEVRDAAALRLAPDAPAGPATVAVLLYQAEGARAVAPSHVDAPLVAGSQDLVVLGEVQVDAGPARR